MIVRFWPVPAVCVPAPVITSFVGAAEFTVNVFEPVLALNVASPVGNVAATAPG